MPGKEERNMRSRKGFTLVEIMIVVAIIVLLAAIAIPNLLRARLSANEATAIAAMRTLSTAMESYRAAQSPPAYPAALTSLNASNPPYIDSVLAGGNKSGYTFTLSGGGNTYGIVATPQSENVTGVRSFFVDQSGVVRVGNSTSGTPIE
jgi:prepilin-type N-terminal cleavage/methylation domain-containing protein